MKSKVKKSLFCIWANVLICSAMFFFLAASVWIRQKYGELLFATVDREFMNFLENKRSLFLMEVCLPAFGFMLLVGGSIFFLIKKKNLSGKFIHGLLLTVTLIFLTVGWQEVGMTSFIRYQIHRSADHWYDENKVVIHALGTIDGLAYTNSKEALEKSFSDGDRVFECDMILTVDEKLVACHDWGAGMQKEFSEDAVPTKEVFMKTPIYGKYTPLSFDEIVLFMKEHKDVYLITDTKSAEGDYYRKEFQEMVDTARVYGCEEVLDRVVVQIYHAYMYGDIQEIYPFKNMIFTLYEEGYRGNPEEMEQYAEFCRKNLIDVITMRQDFYSDELNAICKNYGVQLFVHTVNEDERKEYFLKRRIGVYTDS